ncbi:hypothetical protein TRFO_11821 [Tritrichomonas foetus]|uniref:Uncharacterized protein n=1 Tax=Tritrichomonas foetus TaxID=1144522 RepID=A0A1J4J7I4_9EUKA|nr:hypothetical protein TRFO_11821 [Tritrichomonas foetus]|eukprot:OHS93405.1 hypothetical protein TRFO_11821 [Tritrichomonas foetus]
MVVEGIKNDNKFNLLKPYKIIKTEKSYLIAAQIVLQFFKKKSLDFSLSTISGETDGAISRIDSNIVSESLNINSEDWLNELLNDWDNIKSTIISKNKDIFKNQLQKRLDEVIPENEKYKPKTDKFKINHTPNNQTVNKPKAAAPSKTSRVSIAPKGKSSNQISNVSSPASSQKVDVQLESSSESIEDIPIADIDDEDTGSVNVAPPVTSESSEEKEIPIKSDSSFDEIPVKNDNSSLQDVSIEDVSVKTENSSLLEVPVIKSDQSSDNVIDIASDESYSDMVMSPTKSSTASPSPAKKNPSFRQEDDSDDFKSKTNFGMPPIPTKKADSSDDFDVDVDEDFDDDFDEPSPAKTQNSDNTKSTLYRNIPSPAAEPQIHPLPKPAPKTQNSIINPVASNITDDDSDWDDIEDIDIQLDDD